MAPRASWRGQLKLSLVSCPVRLYTATSRTSRVSFNMLHPETNNRVQMRPHDPELGEVDRADLVKGYEYEKDQYVILDDEDFEKAAIESSETLEIERFVDAADVDELYYDTPYYMAPDGARAEETFRVLHEAMRSEGKVGLSRLVLSNREHMVAISVRDAGFQVMTLRNHDEVRSPTSYFEDIDTDAEIDAEMIEMAQQLIHKREGKFEPKNFHDRYQDALMEIIRAKVEGEEPVVAKAPERGKVVNLMDALKKSVAEEEGGKPPAKSTGRRKSTAPSKAGKQASKSSSSKSAGSGSKSSRAKSSGGGRKRKKASGE